MIDETSRQKTDTWSKVFSALEPWISAQVEYLRGRRGLRARRLPHIPFPRYLDSSAVRDPVRVNLQTSVSILHHGEQIAAFADHNLAPYQ